MYVHVAEVLELVVSKWTMGWDGMGHRGLRNKWPGLPVAMLFPVFGSIEHLNELEQRNIEIRRGLDCLVLEAELCIRLFVPRFFSFSFFFFFLFLRFLFHRVRAFCRIIGSWLRFCYAEPPILMKSISCPFNLSPTLRSIARSFEISFCGRDSLLPDEKWELDSLWI